MVRSAHHDRSMHAADPWIFRSIPVQRSRPPLLPFLHPAQLHPSRSEEHTSELQSPCNLVCRLLLEKKNTVAQRIEVQSLDADSLARLQGLLDETRRAPTDFFFFNDTATTEIYTLSLHDALPI